MGDALSVPFIVSWSGLKGLCGCHLQEKLKCSNGIHDGKS